MSASTCAESQTRGHTVVPGRCLLGALATGCSMWLHPLLTVVVWHVACVLSLSLSLWLQVRTRVHGRRTSRQPARGQLRWRAPFRPVESHTRDLRLHSGRLALPVRELRDAGPYDVDQGSPLGGGCGGARMGPSLGGEHCGASAQAAGHGPVRDDPRGHVGTHRHAIPAAHVARQLVRARSAGGGGPVSASARAPMVCAHLRAGGGCPASWASAVALGSWQRRVVVRVWLPPEPWMAGGGVH